MTQRERVEATRPFLASLPKFYVVLIKKIFNMNNLRDIRSLKDKYLRDTQPQNCFAGSHFKETVYLTFN